jgi:hypothetical protein
MSIHLRGSLAALIVLACAASLTRAGDKEEIKESTLSFSKALAAGDGATARKYVVGDENSNKMVDALAEFTKAAKGLQEAAVAKFGEDGRTLGGLGTGRMGPTNTDFKDFDESRLTINGDTATIAPKAGTPGARPTTFKKIDGTWKLDLTGMFTADHAAQGVAMMPKMAGVMNELAGEIQAGKYASLQEAKSAFYQKLAAAVGAGRPGAQRPPG